MRCILIIFVFFKYLHCAQIHSNDNGMFQNTDLNRPKSDFLDKIADSLQNSRKILQLPNREYFLEKQKKRCEACRESVRCKTQGKCEICNRICKDLETNSTNITDSPQVKREEDSFVLDSSNSNSHVVGTSQSLDKQNRLIKPFYNVNKEELGKTLDGSITDDHNVFQLNRRESENKLMPFSRGVNNQFKPKAFDLLPDDDISVMKNKDSEQHLISELPIENHPRSKMLRNNHKNVFHKTTSASEERSNINKGHLLNSDLLINSNNKKENVEFVKDLSTSEDVNIMTLKKHPFANKKNIKEDIGMNVQDEPDIQTSKTDRNFFYIQQFTELLKDLEKKIENIAYLVKKTCGQDEELVSKRNIILANRFKDSEIETSTPSLLNNSVNGIETILDAPIAKDPPLMANNADTNNADMNDILGLETEAPTRHQQFVKKVDPQSEHNLAKPETAVGQAGSGFVEQIVPINENEPEPDFEESNSEDFHEQNEYLETNPQEEKQNFNPKLNPNDFITENMEKYNLQRSGNQILNEDGEPTRNNAFLPPMEGIAPKVGQQQISEVLSETDSSINKEQDSQMQDPFNIFGKVVPQPNSMKDESKVYFVGNGMQLPLNMKKYDDGSFQLFFDIDKLCEKCAKAKCVVTNKDSNTHNSNIRNIRSITVDTSNKYGHEKKDFQKSNKNNYRYKKFNNWPIKAVTDNNNRFKRSIKSDLDKNSEQDTKNSLIFNINKFVNQKLDSKLNNPKDNINYDNENRNGIKDRFNLVTSILTWMKNLIAQSNH